MLRKTFWKENAEDGGGGTRSLSVARYLNHRASGKAPGWYQLASQDRHVWGLCPLTHQLCWNLSGQLGIPKLCLEPQSHLTQVHRLLLPSRPALPHLFPFIFFHTHLSIYSQTPITSHPSPYCCLPLPGAPSPSRSSIRPIPHLGFFIDS